LVCGDRNVFREFCTLNRAVGEGGETRIGSDNLFMAYSHVAHDCRVGDHVVMANSSALAGHVTVEDHVVIGGLAGIHQFTRIGRFAMVGGGSSITKDVVPYVLVSGDEPKVFGLNLVGLRRGGFTRDEVHGLEQASKVLFGGKYNTSQALEEISKQATGSPHLQHLVDFIKASQRGIHK
jgi:UDP-N-acetylglucosamine acyltransferase